MAYSLKGSKYCLSHDTSPKSVEIRQEAARRAKISREPLWDDCKSRLPKKLKPENLKTLERYVLVTICLVRGGYMEPEQGTALLTGFGVLANILKR
jgi:hypothetical protein